MARFIETFRNNTLRTSRKSQKDSKDFGRIWVFIKNKKLLIAFSLLISVSSSINIARILRLQTKAFPKSNFHNDPPFNNSRPRLSMSKSPTMTPARPLTPKTSLTRITPIKTPVMRTPTTPTPGAIIRYLRNSLIQNYLKV